ncbi:hypothetical protein DFH29DRAFT_945937 [Suillus ampliporus]|nr:hypothetical protein DFH29DRAFT_945937 [Suillus ampliporus]
MYPLSYAYSQHCMHPCAHILVSRAYIHLLFCRLYSLHYLGTLLPYIYVCRVCMCVLLCFLPLCFSMFLTAGAYSSKCD